jgi:hypothetical protein
VDITGRKGGNQSLTSIGEHLPLEISDSNSLIAAASRPHSFSLSNFWDRKEVVGEGREGRGEGGLTNCSL